MRKLALLALPLASLVVLAGCCGVEDECNTCVAPAVVAPAAKPVAVIETPSKVVVEQKVVVAEPVKPAQPKEPIFTQKVVTTPAPSKTAIINEPATEKTRDGLPTIPTMTLPKGWSYVREVELSGGKLNVVPVGQYYSRLPAKTNDEG